MRVVIPPGEGYPSRLLYNEMNVGHVIAIERTSMDKLPDLAYHEHVYYHEHLQYHCTSHPHSVLRSMIRNRPGSKTILENLKGFELLVLF